MHRIPTAVAILAFAFICPAALGDDAPGSPDRIAPPAAPGQLAAAPPPTRTAPPARRPTRARQDKEETTRDPDGPAARIVVTLRPLALWIDQFIDVRDKEAFPVTTIVPDGVDPTTFEPDEAQLALMREAEILICDGGIYDAWAIGSPPAPNLFILRKELERFDINEAIGIAPHEPVWLEPDLMRRLAGSLIRRFAAFVDRNTDHQLMSRVKQALGSTNAEHEVLDEELTKGLIALRGKPICSLRGMLGPLARRFGLRRVVALSPTGEEPDPRAVAKVTEALSAGKTDVIYVERPFDAAPAVEIAESAGGTIIEIDPFGLECTTWSELYRRLLAALTSVPREG